jgi:DNA-binding GntR family transcriptional regulator
MELKVNMNEYLPLRDVVYNTLRQAILRGELKPGERLMEIQLANKLGVSRTPVREAIRKLELDGLVLMIPRKGAEVADISEKSLKDVLEVRKALEELAVQLTCEKISKAQIAELKQAAEEFKKILKSNDITQIAEADVRFHDVIYMATDNQKLIQLLYNLREQMYRYRVEYLKRPGVYPQLIQEHEEIIRQIEKREKEKSDQMVEKGGERVSRGNRDNQVEAVMNVIRTKK